ncbi:MAG: hypothetical protein ACTH31_16450 [Pseudoclavibacter sp.]
MGRPRRFVDRLAVGRLQARRIVPAETEVEVGLVDPSTGTTLPTGSS